MNLYKNYYAVTITSLLCCVISIYILKYLNNIFSFNLIPFFDLILSFILLILCSIISSKLYKINDKIFYKLSIISLIILLIYIINLLVKNNAFYIYYADYANGGPIRKNLYTSYILIIIALLLNIILLKFNELNYKINYFINIIFLIFLIKLSSFNLLVDYSFYTDNAVNLGAVLMPIVNTFNGAYPPIDVQSQYGLYPYFIVPILKIFGLNIFIISVIFFILFFLCFISIYVFVYKILNNSLHASIITFAAFYLNTSFGNIWPGELYFQYRPIRMLSPCISLILIAYYLSNEHTNKFRIIITAILSILVFWNIDSGLPILISFIIANAANDYFKKKYYISNKKINSNFLYLLIEGSLIFILVYLIIILKFYILTGDFLSPKQLLEPQLIWRKNNQYFDGWSQTIILATTVYFASISYSISKGISKDWSINNFRLIYVSIMGLGISTYGTLNPHSAALTLYLLPVVTYLLYIELKNDSNYLKKNFLKYFISFIILFGNCYLATAFILHIKYNTNFSTIPTIFELIYPSINNNKGIFPVPGEKISDTEYVRVKDLATSNFIVPYWMQKGEWLKSITALTNYNSIVFIASMRDHYLYASINKKSPIRIFNFQHIPNYDQWSLLYDSVINLKFDYVVIDEEWFIRNSDSSGPSNYDKFIDILNLNYEKIAQNQIGFDWHFPNWKPSYISVWGVKK